jgi:iron complex outermembrane receptor protein
MQVKNVYVIFIVCLFNSSLLRSQSDSINQLKEIEVNAPRSTQFRPGLKIVELDSFFLAQFSGSSLADALSFEGSVALKQYGNGSLTSSSFRGASSSQTPVIWNGFNIQNPMYGQVDLSLFPVGITDKISLQYGAGATQWGSGAVSGAIVMENKPGFNMGLRLGLASSAGSFGTFSNLLSAGYGSAKAAVSAKVYYSSSENDFPFINTALQGAPEVHETHAALYNYGAISRIDYRISGSQLLSVNAWYQYCNREIPPLMIREKSASKQEDEGYKISAEWKKAFKRAVLTVRSGLFDDQLNYNDSLSSLYSVSHSLSSISELEYTYEKKQSLFHAGINLTYVTARSDGYLEDFEQWHNSIFALYKWKTKNKRIELQVSARKEMINGKLVDPAITIKTETKRYSFLPEGSAGLDAVLFRWLSIKANASTVYRIPTLNDLYWNPGGNPNLEPEEGASEELTAASAFNIRKLKLSYDVTGFNRNVSNWIIWLPGDYYWSPDNILKVWSRGFEHVAAVAYAKNKFSIKLSVNYTYTLSTSRKAISENDASLDQQLIYVPVHQGAVKLSAGFKKWYVSWLHSYTGYRYTSTDNLEYLPEYAIAKASIGNTVSFKKTELSIGISCTNIFDVQYQSVLWRAMPGRSYSVSLKIGFKS